MPDGLGIIDLQKPIQNTTNYNNIASAMGAVEVDDLMAILATSSGQSALTINQNSTGPLISASSSGIAKFTIDNNGTGTFGGNLTINGNNLSTTSTNFDLLNNSAINLNLAGAATSISIGGASGSTKIKNTLIAGGGLTVAADHSLIVSGNVASDLKPFITGVYDLGSVTNHWNNAYIDNLYTTSTATVSGFWQRNNSSISPLNISDNLMIGGNSTQSAKFQKKIIIINRYGDPICTACNSDAWMSVVIEEPSLAPYPAQEEAGGAGGPGARLLCLQCACEEAQARAAAKAAKGGGAGGEGGGGDADATDDEEGGVGGALPGEGARRRMLCRQPGASSSLPLSSSLFPPRCVEGGRCEEKPRLASFLFLACPTGPLERLLSPLAPRLSFSLRSRGARGAIGQE